MIGKGSFARVYLVEEKEKKTRFAVKAFSKDYLLSQNKGKVTFVLSFIYLQFKALLIYLLYINQLFL